MSNPSRKAKQLERKVNHGLALSSDGVHAQEHEYDTVCTPFQHELAREMCWDDCQERRSGARADLDE